MVRLLKTPHANRGVFEDGDFIYRTWRYSVLDKIDKVNFGARRVDKWNPHCLKCNFDIRDR